MTSATSSGLAARRAKRGVATLDCPVTGGVHRAEAGDITVLVGGPPLSSTRTGRRSRRWAARLSTSAARQRRGHQGRHQHARLHPSRRRRRGADAVQARGRRPGGGLRRDPRKLGNSFVHETESQVILNGSYDIGFTMDLACKDAGFATEIGRRLGVPLSSPPPRNRPSSRRGRAMAAAPGRRWSSSSWRTRPETSSARRAFPQSCSGTTRGVGIRRELGAISVGQTLAREHPCGR